MFVTVPPLRTEPETAIKVGSGENRTGRSSVQLRSTHEIDWPISESDQRTGEPLTGVTSRKKRWRPAPAPSAVTSVLPTCVPEPESQTSPGRGRLLAAYG